MSMTPAAATVRTRPAPVLPAPDRISSLVAALRLLLVLALVTGALVYAVSSWRWPLMVDSPIMHYVNYMIDHGLKPYQDITDNNMPGAYLTERWAMTVFGAGDLGWRVYEFVLLAALTLGMVVIARPYDWLAGLYAGGLFILLHGHEGPRYAVEREEVMATLLILGYAACFTAVRRRQPWLMVLFGTLTSLAVAIKPTLAPLPAVVLAIAVWTAYTDHRTTPSDRRTALSLTLWTLAGCALTTAVVLRFLVHFQAVHAFLFVLRVITPSYVALWHPGFLSLVRRSWPVSFVPLLPLALLALALNRRWNWEKTALTAGFFFGLASYFIQQKGFNHHRYTFLCFFLLLAAIEFMTALRRPGWSRAVGITAIAIALLLVPYNIHQQRTVVPNSDLTLQLEQDLRTLGGAARLQNKVQCFDLVFGCLNALYHDDILQNSGFTGDLLFFSGSDSRAARFYKDMFWRLARKDPAEVLVVSNEWFGQDPSFAKLQRWPEFLTYLNTNYTDALNRQFPRENEQSPLPLTDPHIEAYRLYIRRGSPLLHSPLLTAQQPASLSIP